MGGIGRSRAAAKGHVKSSSCGCWARDTDKADQNTADLGNVISTGEEACACVGEDERYQRDIAGLT